MWQGLNAQLCNPTPTPNPHPTPKPNPNPNQGISGGMLLDERGRVIGINAFLR